MPKKNYTRHTVRRFPKTYQCRVCTNFNQFGKRELKGFLCRDCIKKLLSHQRHIASLRAAEERIRNQNQQWIISQRKIDEPLELIPVLVRKGSPSDMSKESP